jgi:hypothetical protein
LSEPKRTMAPPRKLNWICGLCKQKLKTKRALRHHRQNVHDTTKQTFVCHFCYNLYSSVKTRLDHKNSAKYFDCHFCLDKFSTLSERQKHEENHNLPPTNTFQCPNCDSRFQKGCYRLAHFQKTSSTA